MAKKAAKPRSKKKATAPIDAPGTESVHPGPGYSDSPKPAKPSAAPVDPTSEGEAK